MREMVAASRSQGRNSSSLGTLALLLLGATLALSEATTAAGVHTNALHKTTTTKESSTKLPQEDRLGRKLASHGTDLVRGDPWRPFQPLAPRDPPLPSRPPTPGWTSPRGPRGPRIPREPIPPPRHPPRLSPPPRPQWGSPSPPRPWLRSPAPPPRPKYQSVQVAQVTGSSGGYLSATTANQIGTSFMAAVQAHNDYRTLSRVPLLTWDVEVAKYAQKWADRCIFEHSWGPYGENVLVGGGRPETMAPSSVIWWYNEVCDYNFKNPDVNQAGHFTQVVWADTRRIGCGLSTCPQGVTDGKGKVYKRANILVCSYDPPGNGNWREALEANVFEPDEYPKCYG